jgi:C4-dicarboxylate-specific signal transduction histidine kinase
MIESIAFRTRARTIDHLGREQIADCPTAVSELWKNAYDAYARTVSLNIYGATVPVATLIDDGHGMNRQEFESKWLVVGTESKLETAPTSQNDRKGLKPRPKQGQKGIGRLSSAYLGPLLLLVSKRQDAPFVASLIDWRLFENPYLYLNDIEIPVIEFSERHELWQSLPALFDRLMGNVWGTRTDVARDKRIALAWETFDAHESAQGLPITREAIERALLETTFTERYFENWGVWNGASTSGTAMAIAHIAFDLEVQLGGRAAGTENDAATQARDKLSQTLVNFTDPFLTPEERATNIGIEDFRYSATAWVGELPRIIIDSDRSFTYESLEALEHVIEGKVDLEGCFTGRVKAFGAWLDEPIIIPPTVVVAKRSDSRVGEFHLRIGTFEQQQLKSTMDKAIHAHVTDSVARYGGFMVFRNGLRVMPYGRVDNDFFEIEQRRSEHAGREFWSNRRMFGRIAISTEDNPNLRDKAGREGFIDNKAAKVFRDLVTNVLRTAARRYFGSDSDLRAQRVPEIEGENKRRQAEEAQKKVKLRKRREFRSNLEKNLPRLQLLLERLQSLATMAEESSLPEDERELIALRQSLSELKAQRAELALGAPPKNLGSLEKTYAEYRRASVNSADLLARLADSVSLSLERLRPQSGRDAAFAELSRNAAYIHARLRRWASSIREIYSSELKRLDELIDQRNKAYHAEMLPLLSRLEDGDLSLPATLDALESGRDGMDRENSTLFEAYISTLRNLQDSIDLDVLISASLDEVDDARVELARLNSLAQLGITVEIVGHEIEGLEEAVSRGFDSLPLDIKSSRKIQNIIESHHALVDKLRFLSPLKLSGERTKAWIDGAHIVGYIAEFLGATISAKAIDFSFSSAFEKFAVFDQASRILPVFVNLVNNATYWVDQSGADVGRIRLDVVDGAVIVADNGPGVAAEDVRQLFTLFFTRKIRSGRGVGLYLCRSNLAAGGHTISYITDPTKKILPGANFSIEFKGAKYG